MDANVSCFPGRTNSQCSTPPRIRDEDKENISKGHVQFKLSSKDTKRYDGPKKARKQKTRADAAAVPPVEKTSSNQLSTKFCASKGVVELAQRSHEKTAPKPFTPLLPIGQPTVSPSGRSETKHQQGKAPVNVDRMPRLAESEKENVPCVQQKEDGKSQCHVKRRMWEWEKERERLRALDKLEHVQERDEIRSESCRQSVELEDMLEPSRGNLGPLPTIHSSPHSGTGLCIFVLRSFLNFFFFEVASNSSRGLQGPQNVVGENLSIGKILTN
jgi:hypothetical protein